MAEPKAPTRVSKALNTAWVRPFLFLIFIVVAWDLSIRLFKIPAYQIPAPADVVAVLWQDWPELARQSWPTTYATICGFLLSAAFGIPVAMLIAGSKTVESYVYPLLVFSQSVPKVAIAPLFVVWFGFGIIPKVISAFLLGFFPVVVSAVQGFKSVDPDMVDLARARSTMSGSTDLNPCTAETTTGKNPSRKAEMIFGKIPKPNQTTNSGAIAIFGTDWENTSNG